MDSVCGRESSVSPPTVVAPLAIKPAPLTEAHPTSPVPTEQQRLLYQLALAERLRLASAGLAWARPPLSAHHHHLQEASMMGGLMGGHLMGSLGSPLMGGLGSAASLGGALMGGQGGPPPAAFPPPHPLYGYRLMDPRALLPRVGPEEPKPQHSYIGLIAMAILSSPDKKLVLSDIYQYILDHYPYFRSRGPGWRNSIRHNLSLNDCFIKAGRSANGKGHYWAIHPANLDDFRRGDFRRRRAQRRVRKHLGLAVDDDSSPEPPSPTTTTTTTATANANAHAAHESPPAAHHHAHHHHLQQQQQQHHHHTTATALTTPDDGSQPQASSPGLQPQPPIARKRQFDVASLLAPDDKMAKTRRHTGHHHDHLGHDAAEIDVVSDDSHPAPAAASPSPPTPAAHDDEDDEDDDPRPWSLLGWVSGAPWPLPPTTTSDDPEPRPAHDPPPAQ
ncbi:uncharacterized protein [Panulirus ornatus]|uniref:uncharacterized protein n=1 Tax=Panulirus ornatus TaxID=150431 RepID=UPI003A854B55